MDWRRTKTLFIGLLVLLNLFLAATLLYGNTIGSGRSEYEAHAVQILLGRGITYAGTWPDGPETAGMLRFESEMPDAEKLLERLMPDARSRLRDDGVREYSVGSRTLLIGKGADGRDEIVYEDPQAGYLLAGADDAALHRSLVSLFRAIGLGSYRLVADTAPADGQAVSSTPADVTAAPADNAAGPAATISTPADADSDVLVYVQPYREGFLFDNQVTVTLQGGGLRRMSIRLHKEQQMMEPVGGGTGDVLSVQQALLLSPVRGPIEVLDVRFGWGQADAGELYFSPMWRLLLADGRELRLDAYTGVLLSSDESR